MIDKNDFLTAQAILLNEIKKQNADALIINSSQNRYWFLNFLSSAGFVIVDKSGNVSFLIDGRYYHQALSDLGNDIQVFLYTKIDDLKKHLKSLNINFLLMEKTYTSLSEYLMFQKFVKKIGTFEDVAIRNVKFSKEIASLAKAADIAVMTTEFIRNFAQVGKSEKAIALAATIKMLELGGSKNSFDPIVASGVNGANPHHHPTDRLLQENEMITLDLGCVFNNYCSDMTRTWAVGNTQLPKDLQSLHDAVLKAQQLGVQSAIAHNTTCKVDAACRDYLKSLKLDQYFVHSTGHGVGIDIHEQPVISGNLTYNLELVDNMVITVEPGIYIPNYAGLRIEDTVVIQSNQPLVLNKKAHSNSNW